MKSFSSLVSERTSLPVSKAQSERSYVIGMIAQKLKTERLAKPYYFKGEKKIYLKPITDRMVAIRVSHLKRTEDLYYLLSICSDSKSFGQSFFYWTKQTTLPSTTTTTNAC